MHYTRNGRKLTIEPIAKTTYWLKEGPNSKFSLNVHTVFKSIDEVKAILKQCGWVEVNDDDLVIDEELTDCELFVHFE